MQSAKLVSLARSKRCFCKRVFGCNADVNTGTERVFTKTFLGNERAIVNIPSVPVFTVAPSAERALRLSQA